jgi:hypothetical protein
VIINLGHGYRAEWVRGSHFVNYFDDKGINYDTCSFAWDKDETTQMDALTGFLRYEGECP